MIRVVAHHLPQLCHSIVKNGLTPLGRDGVLTGFSLKRLFHLNIERYEVLFKINPLLSITLLIHLIIDGVVVMTKRFLESRPDESLKFTS